jgi:hypothetical protein
METSALLAVAREIIGLEILRNLSTFPLIAVITICAW